MPGSEIWVPLPARHVRGGDENARDAASALLLSQQSVALLFQFGELRLLIGNPVSVSLLVLRAGIGCSLLDELAEIILNDGDAPVDFSQSLVFCHLSNLSSAGEPTLAASLYHFSILVMWAIPCHAGESWRPVITVRTDRWAN